MDTWMKSIPGREGALQPSPKGRQEHAQKQGDQSSWCGVNREEDMIQRAGVPGDYTGPEAIVGALALTVSKMGIQCKVLARGVKCSLWLLL